MKFHITLEFPPPKQPATEVLADPFHFLEHEVPQPIKDQTTLIKFVSDNIFPDPKRPAGMYYGRPGTIAVMGRELDGKQELMVTGRSLPDIKDLYLKIMNGELKPVRNLDDDDR